MSTLTRSLYAVTEDGRKGLLQVEIDPTKITHSLARWLAETISTTSRQDDASILLILYPATEIGLQVRAQGERLTGRSELLSARELEDLLRSLEGWVNHLRAEVRLNGQDMFRRRVAPWQWEAYRPDRHISPEAYYGAEALRIYQSGGIIIEGGLNRATPPQGVLQQMAGGRGPQLLSQWRERVS